MKQGPCLPPCREGVFLIFRDFIKQAANLLGYRWKRFRRDSIRRRVAGRMQRAGVSSYGSYLELLRSDPEEARAFASLFTITISRFYRDREVMEALPGLIRERLGGREPLRVWCSGAASGEEPLTVAILFSHFLGEFPEPEILATEIDPWCLERARAAVYPPGSLRELPRELLEKYFIREGEGFRPREEIRRPVTYLRHNIVSGPPGEGFHLVFCRNLAYTYFQDALQIEVTKKLHRALVPRGILVVGVKDFLPRGAEGLFREVRRAVYERLG